MGNLDKKSKSERKARTKKLLFLGFLVVILSFLAFLLASFEGSDTSKKANFGTSSPEKKKESAKVVGQTSVHNFNQSSEKFKEVKVSKYRKSRDKGSVYYKFNVTTEAPSQKVERTYIRIFKKSVLKEGPTGSFVFEDNLDRAIITEDRIYYQTDWRPKRDLIGETPLFFLIGYVTENDQREEVSFETFAPSLLFRN